MEIEKQYNQIGEKYIAGQKSFFSKREDKAIKFITDSIGELKNKTVLDLGCGDGSDIIIYQNMGASSVYGIDASSYMIEKAKINLPTNNNLFVGSIEKTPFDEAQFDVIAGRFSFHYLANFDVAYKELGRILKPGGLLSLVVHHPLRDLSLTGSKKYGQKEIIQVDLYGGKVNIKFPTHTFNEYFSPTFFEYFYIDGLSEEINPEEYLDEMHSPGFLGIKAVRR